MKQKLEPLSKILIATGQINYMAASIDSVNEQTKMIPDKDGVHSEGIKERDKLLSSVVDKLSRIMEDMGNLINKQDCTCAIDIRVSTVPFEILIHGMDEADNYYEEKTP